MQMLESTTGDAEPAGPWSALFSAAHDGPESSFASHSGVTSVNYRRRPRVRRRKLVPAILFLLTCLSTFWVGITDWQPLYELQNLFVTGPGWLGFDLDFMVLRRLVVRNWGQGLIYMACVLAILMVSSLLTLIDPSSENDICLVARFGSLPLNIIVKASLIAKVAITMSTKLIPSDKFILPKVNLEISDNESCPIEASIKPKTTIIIAFKN